MTSVDLITGLLGAGKTTFIKGYCGYLKRQGETFAIIENEFGAAGVDLALLEELQADVTELSGGCICCTLKVGFAEALLRLSKRYDRIIVEPSGVFTLGDFYEVMHSPAVKDCCQVGAVVAVVNGRALPELSKEDEAVLRSQLSGVGAVLVNRADDSLSLSQLTDAPILQDNGTLTDENYCSISRSTPKAERAFSAEINHSLIYQSCTLYPEHPFLLSELEAIGRELFSPECGKVLRVKGYVQEKDGAAFLINCTPGSIAITSGEPRKTPMVNIIGRKLNRKALRAAFQINDSELL